MTSTMRHSVLPLFLIVGAGLASVQGCGGSRNGGGGGSDGGGPAGSGGIVQPGAGGGAGFGGLDSPAGQGGGGFVGTGGQGATSIDGGAGKDAGTAPVCGQPGTPCCDGNTCAGGGCCVSGICMAQGVACVNLGDGICNAGACGSCGGPGQSCCGTNPATGVCTSPGTICSAGNCTKCGDLGKPCCTSGSGGAGTCNGTNAMCSGDNLCMACGTPGSACCPGNQCDSPGCCYNNVCTAEGSTCGASGGTCQAGRCSACGSASQPCCANVCYEGLLCKGGTCAGCGGLGQACCSGGTGSSACQTGMACTGSGSNGVCSQCGSLGDMCCAGNACSEGCCSGGLCLAPGSGTCPSGSPDGGGQVDAPSGGGGGAGGAGGRGGAGGTIATGSGGAGGKGGTTANTSGAGGTVATGGVGGGTVATGGADGGTTPPWTPPVGCGDGVVVFPERCDDGNTMPFDGCSSDCQNEPICAGSGPCTSKCGDGIVLGEECDDGNTADGDGCSSSCTVEPGFTCEQPPLGDSILVPAVYRDFRFHNPTDFESGTTGSYAPFTGMVNATLNASGKPDYSGIGGYAHVASADSFSQWYKDVSGVNHSTASKMTLWNDGKGNYVNRWGANGEQWPMTETGFFCGTIGSEVLDSNNVAIPCTYRYGSTDCDKMAAKGETMLKCVLSESTYEGVFIVKMLDGTPVFFPVDGDPFTPASERMAATIPPYYDATGTWPYDLDAAGNKRLHNFSFTTEIHYWFRYDKSKSYTLDFVGDDDVWVFINRKLAVDLGGVHTPVDGSIVIGADGNGLTTVTQTYPTPVPPSTKQSVSLGLEDGKVYEIAVFQAERQSNASTFKITLGGFNTAPSECHPN